MAGVLHRIASSLGFVPAADVSAASQAAEATMQRERAAWRVASINHARQLSAAMADHFASNWTTGAEHINVDAAAGLSRVRSRARDAARNNDHARHFVGMAVANVIGATGIRMQSQFAKRSGDLNEAVNERIERARRRWEKKGACDVTGRYSWWQVLRLVTRHLATDGEALLRKVYGRGPHRFQVQLIDPALLDIDFRGERPGGVKIRMGVEFDAEGVVLAYYVRQDTTGSPDGYTGARHMRIPAAEMLHIFLPDEANQLRGVPWLQSGLKRMYLVDDYEQAAVNAARNAAKRAGFFYTPDGEAPPAFAAPAGEDGEAASGTQKVNTLVDGQFDTLPEGTQFQAYTSAFPSTTHGEFTKACLRSIASGLGVSYVTFGNDLEAVNYSSARVGIHEEREVWRALQTFLVEELCEPVASEWLKFAMLADPDLASLSPERLPEYVAALTWQPRRWAAIDPIKDRQADEMGLAMGVLSRHRIAAREGEDLEEIANELRREQALFDGLLPAAPKQAAKPQPDTTDPAATEDSTDPNEATPARALRVVAARSMEHTQ